MNLALSLSNVIGAGLAQDNIQDKLSNTTYVGIDFGTSTTTISYSIIGDRNMPIQTHAMPVGQLLEDGRLYESHLVPTAIAWHKEQLFIGVGASSLKGQLTQGINASHPKLGMLLHQNQLVYLIFSLITRNVMPLLIAVALM